jgi:hypothetical protein
VLLPLLVMQQAMVRVREKVMQLLLLVMGWGLDC